jgi:hypothetical protein
MTERPMEKFYMRNPNSTIVGNHSVAILVTPEGESFYCRSEAETAFRLMEVLREPKSAQEIEQELSVPFARLGALLAGFEKKKSY